MKKLFLSLLICALLIFPVTANTVSFTAPSDKAIWGLDFVAQTGSSGTILLMLEDGSTVSGSWSYTGFLPIVADVDLGGDTSSYSYYVPIPFPLYISAWNGDNTTYGRELKLGYGQNRLNWNDVVVASISSSPTVQYTIVSDSDITVDHELVDRAEATKRLTAGDPFEGSVLDILFSELDTVMSIFFSVIWWLKFLFVDYLMLTVSLYFSGSMAYAMLTSRNIFVFYKVWFRQQRALFEFIVTMTSQVISIVAQVGGLAISGASSLLGKIVKFFV